jgi:hypothetical protein
VVFEAFQGAFCPLLPSVLDDLARGGFTVELLWLPIIRQAMALACACPRHGGFGINFFGGCGGSFFIKGQGGCPRDFRTCHVTGRDFT